MSELSDLDRALKYAERINIPKPVTTPERVWEQTVALVRAAMLGTCRHHADSTCPTCDALRRWAKAVNNGTSLYV